MGEDGRGLPGTLAALADRYLSAGRLDEAERWFKAAIQVMPDMQCYRKLADVYLRRDDEDRWLATLEEVLKEPDYGLAHARVQEEIAWHFMNRKAWKKALPYALRSAESYSAWGLVCAASCYEGMQDWEHAEAIYRACGERYRDDAMEWYFFCRRTGHGDLEAARRFAEAVIEKPAREGFWPDAGEMSAYYLLEKQPAKALPYLEKDFARLADPHLGLRVALTADELNDTTRRQAAFERIKTEGPKAIDPEVGRPRTELIALTDLIAADLAQGGKGAIDLAVADKFAAGVKGFERVQLCCDLCAIPPFARQARRGRALLEAVRGGQQDVQSQPYARRRRPLGPRHQARRLSVAPRTPARRGAAANQDQARPQDRTRTIGQIIASE